MAIASVGVAASVRRFMKLSSQRCHYVHGRNPWIARAFVPARRKSTWTAARTRAAFLQYFADKSHEVVPSSPVIPYNDNTVLFTNAGMNQVEEIHTSHGHELTQLSCVQFKDVFLGQADPSTLFARLKRACSSQKCIRAGGKHNDLDDVGLDLSVCIRLLQTQALRGFFVLTAL